MCAESHLNYIVVKNFELAGQKKSLDELSGMCIPVGFLLAQANGVFAFMLRYFTLTTDAALGYR